MMGEFVLIKSFLLLAAGVCIGAYLTCEFLIEEAGKNEDNEVE